MSSIHNLPNEMQHAVDEMYDMNKRAKHFEEDGVNEVKQNSISGINISSDALLVFSLVLILLNENNDKLILLALLYILS